MLIRQHEQLLNSQVAGIDYRQVTAARPWPFTAFVQTCARLLGRKGGLSAFHAFDLERLKKTYNRGRALHETFVTEALAKAPDKSLNGLLDQLQYLITFQKETGPCT